MKNIFISVFAFIFTCNLSAQDHSAIKLSSERDQFFKADSLIQSLNKRNPRTRLLKLGFESQKRLDSLVRYNFFSEFDSVKYQKTEEKYDQANKVEWSFKYNWSAFENKWKPTEKSSLSFNSFQNSFKYELYVMGGGHNPEEWQVIFQLTEKYDSADRLISSEYKYYDLHANRLVPDEKTEWTYNESGFKTESISFYWSISYGDWTTGKWQPRLKTGYNYDSSGNLVLETSAYWLEDLSDWASDHEKIENSYDTGGNILLVLIYDWSSVQNSWIPSIKGEYIYDGTGNLIKWVTWSMENYDWIPGSKYEYGYGASGKLASETDYVWNLNRSVWIPTTRYEYEHHTNGLRIETTKFSWNPNDAIWVGSYRTILILDAEGDIFVLNLFNWDQNNNDWVIGTRTFYYYNHLNAVNLRTEDDMFLIYPNPTSNIINITGLNQPVGVKIYSVQGQLLKSVNQVNSTIDLSDLPNGIYILNLTMGTHVLRERIVKK